MQNIHISGIICVIILLAALIWFLKTNVLDNFVVFLDEQVIPNDCYNYLVTNGSKFFLLDTRKLFDGNTNPRAFDTREAAIEHLKQIGCNTDLPFVNIRQKKKNEDPTVSYQRECNRKIAPHLFDLDICNIYGSDNDVSSAAGFAKINKIESDRTQYANYDQETCMIDRAVKTDPALDDKHFKQYFADYFDRLNNTIDQQYLYISSN